MIHLAVALPVLASSQLAWGVSKPGRAPIAQAPSTHRPLAAGQARSGKVTVEEFNRLILEQLYREHPEKCNDPRKRSFSLSDWPQVKRFVRADEDDVPILGSPALDSRTLDIQGIAGKGELFALVDQQDIIRIPNFLSNSPDSGGLWYKVELLDRTQGWIFAKPAGHDGAPFATCLALRDGQLVETRGGNAQGQSTGTEAMEDARASGGTAGENDGKRAGYADGFAEASQTAEKRSYSETIAKLYASRDYHRLTFYTCITIIGGFLIGFTLQYVAVLVVRKCGLLQHIDPIILGNRVDEAALSALALPTASPMHKVLSRTPRVLSILVIALLFGFVGCENPEKEAYKKAYDAHYEAGKHAGRQDGEAAGNKAGGEKGEVEAKEAAQSGRAWQLYEPLAIGALICGFVVGLLAQYMLLIVCRFSERLQQLLSALASADPKLLLECDSPGAYQQLTVAFVPAMKTTKSYNILRQAQRFIDEVEELRRSQTMSAARIHATVQGVKKVYNDVGVGRSSLETLEKAGWGRLLYLAKAELDKIASEAQAKANRMVAQENSRRQNPPKSQGSGGSHRG